MKKAFTLIELLITCALIMLLSALALPRLTFLSSGSLSRELTVLNTACAYLHHKAMATNRNLELIFDGAKNSYSYNGIHNRSQTHTLPRSIMFGFIPDAKGPPSKPQRKINTAITFASCAPGKYVITFYPDGTTSSGTVYLTDKDRKNMVALTCPIAPVSYIRMYRYDNAKWVKT